MLNVRKDESYAKGRPDVLLKILRGREKKILLENGGWRVVLIGNVSLSDKDELPAGGGASVGKELDLSLADVRHDT